MNRLQCERATLFWLTPIDLAIMSSNSTAVTGSLLRQFRYTKQKYDSLKSKHRILA